MTGIWLETIVAWALLALAAGRFATARSWATFAGALLVLLAASVVAVNAVDPPAYYSASAFAWAMGGAAAGGIVCAVVLAREGWRRWRDRGVPSRQSRAYDWLTVILLPVGGLMPFVGWAVVLFLVWTSRAWTSSEKRWATVGFPGGPLVGFLALPTVLDASWPFVLKVVVASAVLLLCLVPSGAAIMLGRRLRRGAGGPVAAETAS